jgi:hypothetical protein
VKTFVYLFAWICVGWKYVCIFVLYGKEIKTRNTKRSENTERVKSNMTTTRQDSEARPVNPARSPLQNERVKPRTKRKKNIVEKTREKWKEEKRTRVVLFLQLLSRYFCVE